jgi:hypothetical protein
MSFGLDRKGGSIDGGSVRDAPFPVGGAAGTMAGVVCEGGHAMINQ